MEQQILYAAFRYVYFDCIKLGEIQHNRTTQKHITKHINTEKYIENQRQNHAHITFFLKGIPGIPGSRN